jgi:anti-anti-sigma factor
MTLNHETSRAGTEITVALAGEADLATSGALRDALFDAVTERPRRLTVNLHALTFIDSMSIGVLIGARRAALAHKIAFTVAEAQGNVHHVLEVSGALAILSEVPDDAEEAG